MRRILARLGRDATYTPAGGQGVTVRGVYSAPYEVAPLGIGIAGSNPRFACMSEDIQGVASGDALTVNATDYKVVTPEPDPVSGITVLQLEEQ